MGRLSDSRFDCQTKPPQNATLKRAATATLPDQSERNQADEIEKMAKGKNHGSALKALEWNPAEESRVRGLC